MRRQVAAITPQRDGKLYEIKQDIRNRAKNPTTNRNNKHNRKLLMFTTFKDTAEYLYQNLTGLAAELGLNVGMVSGDETHTTTGDNDFNAILTNFSPVARNRASAVRASDIDLLIATDCISEGQNLQDCDTVINYDIHWNPVRLIQRFGRIDRNRQLQPLRADGQLLAHRGYGRVPEAGEPGAGPHGPGRHCRQRRRRPLHRGTTPSSN